MAVYAKAAHPVARWDVVPYQRIDGVFKAGVVAFHDEGVQVVFEVAGKKFTAEEPKLNDRTGVWEFFVPINVAKLPDGPISLKATAISLGSAPESFELPELPLYANEANHRYALSKGSPALNHGVSLQCVPADIDGKPYTKGPRPCGAYAE